MSLPQPASLKLLALATLALPTLVAAHVAPSATFFNQVLALGLWGCWMAACPTGARLPSAGPHAQRHWMAWAWPLQVCLSMLMLAAAGSHFLGSLPASLAWPAIGLLLAAMSLVAHGAAVGTQGSPRPMQTMATAMVAMAVVNAVLGYVQVVLPFWADGTWLAASAVPGRAIGNLRQPNHLSALLMWGAACLPALVQWQRVSERAAWGAMALCLLGVVFTGSRTGILGVALLFLWGCSRATFAAPARRLLLATPVLFGALWGLVALWARFSGHAFHGAERMQAQGDLSSSRMAIWRDTLDLIAQQPWAGVGFGEFNLAWSLTPFPKRPVAFFDHAHNLSLHLTAEVGLPAALAITALLLLALWQVWRGMARQAGDARVALSTAWMLVLLILLHSQLEYPLWYAYFLLPTAWLWGHAWGLAHAPTPLPTQTPATVATKPGPAWQAAGVVMVLAALFSIWDYSRVARIFTADRATPLEQRIAEGRHSLFFGHHADYAAATWGEPLPDLDDAFARASHFLLDTRFMMAWARHEAAASQLAKARHLAQRLREFRNPSAHSFFAVCDAPDAAMNAQRQPPPSSLQEESSDRPFQCTPPQGPALHWRDFTR